MNEKSGDAMRPCESLPEKVPSHVAQYHAVSSAQVHYEQTVRQRRVKPSLKMCHHMWHNTTPSHPKAPRTRGLHSSNFQLNVSTFCGVR